MPEKKQTGTKSSPRGTRTTSGMIADSAEKFVHNASKVLQQELATGLEVAKKVEAEYEKTKKIDEELFGDAVKRFRIVANELIAAAGARINEIGTPDANMLSVRFVKDAKQILNAFVDLALLTPQVVNTTLRS